MTPSHSRSPSTGEPRTITDRTEAGNALREEFTGLPPRTGSHLQAGLLAGLPLHATAADGAWRLHLDGADRHAVLDLDDTTEPARLILRLENQSRRLDQTLADLRDQRTRAGANLARARTLHGQPFPHVDRLRASRTAARC